MADYTYSNQYNKENYFKVSFRVPKEKKDVLKELAKQKGVSTNQLITSALEKQYKINLTIREDE